MASPRKRNGGGDDPRDSPPPKVFGEDLSGICDWWMVSFIRYATHQSGSPEGNVQNGQHVIIDENVALLGSSDCEA
jgi:hypothetical protein